MTFDPDTVRERLAELGADPGVLAEVDQRQAALNDALNVGTWWALLAALSQGDGREIAYAAAMFSLRKYLDDLPEEMTAQLVAFLMTDTVHRIAKYEHGGDLNATAEAIVRQPSMVNVHKFVASDGQACSFCGADDGWGDHECPSNSERDEPE